MEKMIEVKNVYKKYNLYKNSRERLLDIFLPGKYSEQFYALTDVNFVANEGEVVGFIGTNGSGKSTLSNIIAGIVPETSGKVIVNGDVSIIAVSAGLKNDLSGRDNIELKLLMLGFDKKEIKELEAGIIEFAELEDFIDQPVKSYSSGMKSRLGFAISISVNPDVLVIDEALSVGDKAFSEKSLKKMREFKDNGKTMIFVSHSIGQMKRFCDKILWLEYGRVKDYGLVTDVLPKYEAFLEQWKMMSKQERLLYKQNINENKEQLNQKMMSNIKTQLKSFIEEKPISRLGRLKVGRNILVYDSPYKEKHKVIKSMYYETTFYIKKHVVFNDKVYYLISSEPSAVKGIIGWIRKKDIQTYMHTLIDEDKKTFKIDGTGSAFSKPWGARKDIVIEDLSVYSKQTLHVSRTERVGKVIWYFGTLEKKEVWINGRHLDCNK